MLAINYLDILQGSLSGQLLLELTTLLILIRQWNSVQDRRMYSARSGDNWELERNTKNVNKRPREAKQDCSAGFI